MQTITLPARCDRASLIDLLSQLRAAAGEPVMVDGGKVEQAGQALLQMLVSFRKSQPESMILPSPALRDIARTAVLDRFLFDEASQ